MKKVEFLQPYISTEVAYGTGDIVVLADDVAAALQEIGYLKIISTVKQTAAAQEGVVNE